MMRLIGNLISGSTNKFKMGDRVHLKNDTYSAKKGRRTVYIVDDVCYTNTGSWYNLTVENRCRRLVGGLPITDRSLIDASNAPPTPPLEEEYPWLKRFQSSKERTINDD